MHQFWFDKLIFVTRLTHITLQILKNFKAVKIEGTSLCLTAVCTAPFRRIMNVISIIRSETVKLPL